MVYLGRRRTALPDAGDGPWDAVVSYLSPWIVPAAWLARARVAAINFHPGPPEYPGIGCTNFALYDEASDYGVTCHHMAPAVDTGPIIRVVRFPLYPTDTVWSVTQRAYAHLVGLFYEAADRLLAGQALPRAGARWARQPFRRAELQALCRLTRDMSPHEIRRRIRATTFPGYPAAAFVETPDRAESTAR
jgi:methionyl-tRNA formyltransferase